MGRRTEEVKISIIFIFYCRITWYLGTPSPSQINNLGKGYTFLTFFYVPIVSYVKYMEMNVFYDKSNMEGINPYKWLKFLF